MTLSHSDPWRTTVDKVSTFPPVVHFILTLYQSRKPVIQEWTSSLFLLVSIRQQPASSTRADHAAISWIASRNEIVAGLFVSGSLNDTVNDQFVNSADYSCSSTSLTRGSHGDDPNAVDERSSLLIPPCNRFYRSIYLVTWQRSRFLIGEFARVINAVECRFSNVSVEFISESSLFPHGYRLFMEVSMSRLKKRC